MSDMGLEAPDLEAPTRCGGAAPGVIPDATTTDEARRAQEPPLEADEADAAEQAERMSALDDDEYR